VNSQIVRLYTFILLLFAVLVYFTSKWAVFDADALDENPDNRRALIEEQQIARGSITSSDGVLIAESNPTGPGNNAVYIRTYPQGALFGNPVGYSFVDIGRTGIELSENDQLIGEGNEFETLIEQIKDEAQEGNDITLTLDAGAQQVALDALQNAIATTPGTNGAGSVVAIEPATGAVRVMASLPGYDPNAVNDPEVFSELSESEAGPLINRPTQGVYEPGSTMKVVTAVAALDSGEFETSTVLNADSPKEISGFPLNNAGGQSFGDIDMTTALTNSVNTYWAQVGEQLGPETYFEYLDRFGFNKDPELDYPDEFMAPSGVYSEGKLLDPGDAIDIGRVAIGQERMLASPMQMAEVAAAVANGGDLMQPTFLQQVVDPDGRKTEELDPDVQSEVMSDETAAEVTEMMVNVANEGTAAGLSTSLGQLAGKTGTAERDVEASINRPWFIGFAPAEDPQIAVAVMLERCVGCFGGEVAGPVATQVMDAFAGG
jgi:peptidoglycan glycosyltransferase